MENLKIVKDNDTWTLPENAWIGDLPFSVRGNYQNRACQHGGVNTGDGKIDSRKIEITIYVDAETGPRYFAALDFIKSKLYREDMKLYIAESRYVNLDALNSFSEENITGYMNRRCFVKATYHCTDPFWYGAEESVNTFAISGSPQTVTLRNDGNIETPLIVTVTADSVAVPEIKITNITTGRAMYYKDPQMAVGASVVINAETGSVLRNGGNSINAFRGTFPTIAPGENELSVESAACALGIAYRPRWL